MEMKVRCPPKHTVLHRVEELFGIVPLGRMHGAIIHGFPALDALDRTEQKA